MTISYKPLVGFVLCLATSACGNDASTNLGEVGALGEELSDYTGRWEGYTEAYEFADGSDRVKLVLDAYGVGIVTMGEDVPRASPEIATAPGGIPLTVGEFPGRVIYVNVPFVGRPAPGFDYPIVDAKVETRRINFTSRILAPYADWCETFTPIEIFDQGETRFTCYEWHGTSEDDIGCYRRGEAIECADSFCTRACDCDADRCFIHDCDPDDCLRHEIANLTFEFDGALETTRDALNGTLVIAGERITVRLTRQ